MTPWLQQSQNKFKINAFQRIDFLCFNRVFCY